MAVNINISGLKMEDDSKLLNGLNVHGSNVDISIKNASVKGNISILDEKVYNAEDVKVHIENLEFNSSEAHREIKRSFLGNLKNSLMEARDKNSDRSR